MKEYKGVKIPKCNGRPQLWIQSWGFELNMQRIRIIMPGGIVLYDDNNLGIDYQHSSSTKLIKGCTSRRNQLSAIKAIIDYFGQATDSGKPEFLGYL